MTTSPSPEAITHEFQTALKHTLVYGLGSIAVKVLGFLMLPFYTHYLTPQDYGTLEILDLSMSLLGMFLNLGISAALLRQYAAGKTAQEKRETVSTSVIFVLAIGSLTFLLFAAVAGPAATLIIGPGFGSTPVLLSMASLVLGFIANPCRAYLRALGASTAFVLVDTVGVFIMLVLNVLFIAVLKLGLLGILLSSALVVGAQAVALVGWTFRRAGFGYSAALLSRMVSFGTPLILSNLAIFILNFSDRFFLQHLKSLEMVGIYAVGYKFAFMLNYLVVQPFSAMWEPQRYVVHAQDNHRAVFDQMFVLYAVALTYGALTLSIIGPEIVHLMVGPTFAVSRSVIPIVAFGYVFWGLGYYAQNGMLLANRTKLIGLISAGAVVLNVGLNYVLILYYGFLGAAWATMISFAAIAVASHYASEKTLPLISSTSSVVKVLAVGIILYFVASWYSPGAVILAGFFKIAVLALFPLVIWTLGILSPAAKETLLAAKTNLLARMATLSALCGIRSSLWKPSRG